MYVTGPAGAVVDSPGAGGPEFEGVGVEVVAAPVGWAGDMDIFSTHQISSVDAELVDDFDDFFEQGFA